MCFTMKGKASKGLTSLGLTKEWFLGPARPFSSFWEKFLISEPKWLTGARTENQENGNLVQPRKVQPERYNPQQLPISGHDPFVYLDFKSLNLLIISTN